MNSWLPLKSLLLNLSYGFLIATLLIISFILIRRIWLLSEARLRKRHTDLFIKLTIRNIHEMILKRWTRKSGNFNRLKVFTLGKYPRNILMEVLVDFARKLQGRYHQAIVELYEQLRLTKESQNKLQSSDKRNVLKGIREMDLFGVPIKDEVITKLLNDPDENVRREAVTLLFHSRKDPFELLYRSAPDFSQYQRVVLFENLSLLPPEKIPDLSYALESPRVSIRKFALQLIGSLGLKMYFFRLLRMLKMEDPPMRLAIVETMSKLNDKRYDRVFSSLLTDSDRNIRAFVRRHLKKRHLLDLNTLKERKDVVYT